MRVAKTVLAGVVVLAALPAAQDVTYLNGQVRLEGGGSLGKSVEIKLRCPGGDAVRQTVTNKKGGYFLKVERDDFNHVARTLPAVSMDMRSEPLAGTCRLTAVLAGYDSTEINLSTFVIGKDLKLPDLVLTPRGSH